MKGPFFLKIKVISLALSFFLLSACASIVPQIRLHEEDLMNLIKANIYKDASLRFASLGKLSIKAAMYSYDLNLKAVTRLKPFGMRLELYKGDVVPIMVLVCQEEHWTLISYIEKIIYSGKASCNLPLGVLEVPISKVGLISILYGRPVLYDDPLIREDLNQMSVRSEDCNEIILAFERGKLHLRPIENDADLEITFLGIPSGAISLGPVSIKIGKLGTDIIYTPELIKEDIEIPDGLFEEYLPPGFSIRSIEEIR